jgi:putative ABC transport system permease protein
MLKLVDITKVYVSSDFQVNALKGISLEFRKSEFVSILGPSGCGKTTLLNIIGGLDRYSSGDLIINGKSTKNFKDKDWDTYRNHSIGFIFQSYNLIMHQSVLSNVELALTLAGINREERKKRAVEALIKVGLKEQINKKPNELSGGQMQRVAIARAIVNNPDIILADEPTGALDTETSIQILDLLKEVAKDRLVIMVTHNADLANKYSTRIINLLDGSITNDNNPYNMSEEEKNEELKELKDKENYYLTHKKEQRKNERKTSMSFFTAIRLSLNNLRTKKGRTFMTAFAGSIGIIGVALVLALSNGFTNYINYMQSDSLSGYPISVSTATIDYDKFNSFEVQTDSTDTSNGDYVVVYDSTMQKYIKYGHYNIIGKDFIEKVENFKQNNEKLQQKQVNLIQYNYFTPFKILFEYGGNMNLTVNSNKLSIMTGESKGVFYESLSDEDFMLSQYDEIYKTDDYNKDDKYGLTLVVDKGNKLNSSILKSIGIDVVSNGDGTYKNILFSDICSKTYKLITNNDYYSYDSESDSYTSLTNSNQTELTNLYNSSSTKTLKINRILRQKEDSTISLLSSGVMFSSTLAKEYREDCKTSDIAVKQNARKSTQSTNYVFYDPLKLSIAEFNGILPKDGFVDTDSINSFLTNSFKITMNIDEAYDLAMQQIGISTVPQSVFFYPNNFDGKNAVINMIKEYNSSADSLHQIVYGDQSEFITSTLGKIVSIVSYVLIAFASISLIVSSIMISVITYTSVIERTKEIGILRSIGARKKDVSRVFNAETIILGFISGFIGIMISYVLCVPITLIIKSLSNINNIADLSIIHSIILIGISIVLSYIAGLVPSKIASKKDPVAALRSE